MNLTSPQTKALYALIDALLGRELAAQDVKQSPTLTRRARLYFAKRQEDAAIARAFRLGLRPERAYLASDWTVYLLADGTASLSSEEELDTDALNRRATLKEANELLRGYELRLWPTSEDYSCAVLLGSTRGGGTFLATALLGDDGRVDLLQTNNRTTALTLYRRFDEARELPPELVCSGETARAAWAFEFRDAPPRYLVEA